MNISKLEMHELEVVLSLAQEELRGVEEATEYVLTTGAKESVDAALLWVVKKLDWLERTDAISNEEY